MYEGNQVIVVAPCYNERAKIGKVIERILAMPHPVVDEILVVDDGSTDGSADMARALGATVMALSRLEGVGFALRMGYRYALEKRHDLIVTIAGNNKDEPREIPDLLEPIVKQGYDFVQGSRFLKKGKLGHMPIYRRILTRVHPVLFSLCTGKRVTESTNGFRAFRASLLHDKGIMLDQAWLNQYELEPYLYYKAIALGYKTTEVPCTKVYPPKKIGYTKMTPVAGWWSILRPLILLKSGLRE